jgi:Arc/MetJ family transcription regulator
VNIRSRSGAGRDLVLPLAGAHIALPGRVWRCSAGGGEPGRRGCRSTRRHAPRSVRCWQALPTSAYTSRTPYVYSACMARTRTNIELEDDDVRAIMDRYGVHTKTEAVALALRHLAGQPMTREEALAMRGAHAIAALPPDTAPRGAA